MKNTTIIQDYIEALGQRSEMVGDGRLDYALGFLQGTLKALKLQSYELEVLQKDILNLKHLTIQS